MNAKASNKTNFYYINAKILESQLIINNLQFARKISKKMKKTAQKSNESGRNFSFLKNFYFY